MKAASEPTEREAAAAGATKVKAKGMEAAAPGKGQEQGVTMVATASLEMHDAVGEAHAETVAKAMAAPTATAPQQGTSESLSAGAEDESGPTLAAEASLTASAARPSAERRLGALQADAAAAKSVVAEESEAVAMSAAGAKTRREGRVELRSCRTIARFTRLRVSTRATTLWHCSVCDAKAVELR